MSKQLTKQKLLEELENVIDKTKKCMVEHKEEFVSGVCSWIGDYWDISLYCDSDGKECSVSELIEEITKTETILGYKGGEYSVYPSTLIWADGYGEYVGFLVVGVKEEENQVVILTENEW